MPGGLHLDATAELGIDRALAVDGLAEGVDDATHGGLADGDLHDARGALHGVAFLDEARVAEERATHVVLLEVENEPEDRGVVGPRELEELTGHGPGEAVHARDAVADREHGAGLGHLHRLVDVLDLLLDDLGDLFGSKLHSRDPRGDGCDS